MRVKSVRKGSTEEYVGEPKGGKEKRKKKQILREVRTDKMRWMDLDLRFQ